MKPILTVFARPRHSLRKTRTCMYIFFTELSLFCILKIAREKFIFGDFIKSTFRVTISGFFCLCFVRDLAGVFLHIEITLEIISETHFYVKPNIESRMAETVKCKWIFLFIFFALKRILPFTIFHSDKIAIPSFLLTARLLKFQF